MEYQYSARELANVVICLHLLPPLFASGKSVWHVGMGSVGSNVTGTTTIDPTTFLPDATPTLSERDQLKIEFYKTYDVMTGVRIAATLGGFFSLMVLLVVYKSR